MSSWQGIGHSSWLVTIPEEASVAERYGETVLESPHSRLVLRQLPSPMPQFLSDMKAGGVRFGQVIDSAERWDVPNPRARLIHCLRTLVGLGLVHVTATGGDERLATLVATSPLFVLGCDEPANARYVLSRFAFLRRGGRECVLETPRSAARLVLRDPRTMLLLCAYSTPATPGDVAAEVPGLSDESVSQLTGLLLNAQMLTTVGDADMTAEDLDDRLVTWEFHDLLFHTRSRGARHDGPLGETYAHAGRLAPLPAVKPIGPGAVVPLPRPDLNRLKKHDPPLARVMEERRSIREYADEPLTVSQLGEFLYRVARITDRSEFTAPASAGAVSVEIVTRTYPSGGALHELEFYLVVQSCRGLDAGLYRYDPLGHALETISPWTVETGRLADDAGRAAAIPPDHIQILIVLAARFGRIAWKYSGVAYSLVVKHVGVVYEAMYLAATAMRLAPCGLGMGDSELFSRAIGSDFYAETSVGEFLLGSRDSS